MTIKPFTALGTAFLFSSCTFASLDSRLELQLCVGSGSGVHFEKNISALPDGAGAIFTKILVLPSFKRGLYYRPYSDDTIWAAGNRVEAVHFYSAEELAEIAEEKCKLPEGNMGMGNFLILELPDGRYFGILPLVSPRAAAEMDVAEGQLFCRLFTWGTARAEGDYPLFAYATANDPYSVSRICWEQALSAIGHTTRLREEKDYPEPFNYLGWCSWEKFKWNINEENMTAAIKGLKNHEVPFRWFLLDDGYLDLRNKQLLSFGVDPEKFPNGLTPLTKLKDEATIKWMGIWRNFNGINRGVHKEHTMAHLQEHFVAGLPGEHHNEHWILQPNAQASEAFYSEMVGHSKGNGFDFVKVDFQSRAIGLHRGSGNSVYQIHLRNQALGKICDEMNIGLLHCIAQYNLNFFNTHYSALMRSGEDYKKEITNTAIVQQCFDNHLWMGPIVWGDLDSFYSSKDDEALFLSLARAISGGPVYPSDDPGKMNPSIFQPIIYSDGRLLRTLAPGVPLPDSIFSDSLCDESAEQIIAPLKQKVAAIASFNLREDTMVSATISPADYACAGGLIQPYEGLWSVSVDTVIYDWFAKSGRAFIKPIEKNLSALECALHLIAPVQNGWAVIGRSDKYMGAMAVESVEADSGRLTLFLERAGPLVIYAESEPTSDEYSIASLGNGFYELQIPASDEPVSVVLKR